MKSMLQVLSCDLVGKGLMALVSALLIRYMTEPDYALYSVTYALLMIFIQLCSGALNRVYVIGFDRFDLRTDPAVLTRLQLLMVCVGAPVLIALIGSRKPIAWVCAAAMLFGCNAELVKSRFQQQMRFGRYSSVEFLRAVIVCAGVGTLIWALRLQLSAAATLAIQVVGYASVLLLYGLPRLRVHRREAWHATRRLAVNLWQGPYRFLFVYFLILAVFSQIDILVLRWMGTQHQVAAYAAAYRYYNVLVLALGAANAVLLPAAQRVRSAGGAAALRRQHQGGLYFFAPLVLLALSVAGWIMPLVDGGRYPESPAVFRILAVSSLFSFAMSPALNLVLGAEDFRFLVMVAAVCCVLGPLLNVLFIPRLGAIGTAWSLLISMAALNGAGFWRSLRYHAAEPLAVAA